MSSKILRKRTQEKMVKTEKVNNCSFISILFLDEGEETSLLCYFSSFLFNSSLNATSEKGESMGGRSRINFLLPVAMRAFLDREQEGKERAS